jgi:hypothetical protein
VDIEKFLRGRDLSGMQVYMFYAQAWLATHLLFNRPERAAGFDRYCKALEGGGDPIDAFKPAFGITPQEFEQELRRYRYSGIQILHLPDDKTDYAASIVTQRLSAAADDLLMPMSHLQVVPSRQHAWENVGRVRQAAAKHADDPFAQLALAHVETWYGETSEARRWVDALLAASANNAEAYHLSGVCDLLAAERTDDPDLYERARGAFAKAHKLDGTRFASLFRYVECDLAIEHQMTDHMLDVLLTAYKLAPQIDNLALLTAQALMQHEHWNEAIHILLPLGSAAHGEPPEHVQALIEAAREKRRGAFAVFGAASQMVDGAEAEKE